MGKSKGFPDPVPNKFPTTLCKLLFMANARESSHQFQSEIFEVSEAVGDSLDYLGRVVRAFEDVGSKPHHAGRSNTLGTPTQHPAEFADIVKAMLVGYCLAQFNALIEQAQCALLAASRPDRLKLGGDGVEVGKQLVVFAQQP